jgi:hypothetical protein
MIDLKLKNGTGWMTLNEGIKPSLLRIGIDL